MSEPALAVRPDGLPPFTPTVEYGVAGPRGRMGFLLRVPRNERLLWDLENEVVTTGREWQEERGGWWIAGAYLDTVIDAVLRSFSSVLVLDRERGDRLLSRDGTAALQERLL